MLREGMGWFLKNSQETSEVQQMGTAPSVTLYRVRMS